MNNLGKAISVLMLGASALGVATFSATAHKGAKGVVKERMNAMKDMGKGMKAVGLMIAGRETYDAAQVKDAAKMIRAHAMKIPKLFPKGTGHKPSVAKALIWKEWKEFKASAAQLAGYAQALEEGAGNKMAMGGMKITPQMMTDPAHLKMMPPKIIFAQVAKTCSACHETYRTEKKK